MSHLTQLEMLGCVESFLTSLFGADVYRQWKELKQQMSFPSEKTFVSWLLSAAIQQTQLIDAAAAAESGSAAQAQFETDSIVQTVSTAAGDVVVTSNPRLQPGHSHSQVLNVAVTDQTTVAKHQTALAKSDHHHQQQHIQVKYQDVDYANEVAAAQVLTATSFAQLVKSEGVGKPGSIATLYDKGGAAPTLLHGTIIYDGKDDCDDDDDDGSAPTAYVGISDSDDLLIAEAIHSQGGLTLTTTSTGAVIPIAIADHHLVSPSPQQLPSISTTPIHAPPPPTSNRTSSTSSSRHRKSASTSNTAASTSASGTHSHTSSQNTVGQSSSGGGGMVGKPPRKKHRVLRCFVCQENFETERELSKHKQIAHSGNSKVFPCDLCEKMFLRLHHLKRHRIEVHLKLKSYQCSFCDAAFSRINRLNIHMTKSHSNQIPAPALAAIAAAANAAAATKENATATTTTTVVASTTTTDTTTTATTTEKKPPPVCGASTSGTQTLTLTTAAAAPSTSNSTSMSVAASAGT